MIYVDANRYAAQRAARRRRQREFRGSLIKAFMIILGGIAGLVLGWLAAYAMTGRDILGVLR